MAEIKIRLRGEDIGDVFVSVWDKKTIDGSQVLDGKRLNENAVINLTVTADGDNKGQIAWHAVRVDDAAAVFV